MQELILSGRKWTFDETKRLGTAGGFGEVFLGFDDGQNPVAIKRLHASVQRTAKRELEIAEFLTNQDYPHVIPFYSAGIDALSDQMFIVMAKAEQSLEDLIGRSIAETDALKIISEIVAGLIEIRGLIHRDLKPANVLFHEGAWKLADLGLARFVELSTSLNTMKDYLSAPYAAPEQWRGDRASKATDVYAVGCIMYALLSGSPPFLGPTFDDYSEQHQFNSPPELPASAPIQRLALECLAKNQQLRPSLESLSTQLHRIRTRAGTVQPNSLAAAAAEIAQAISSEAAHSLQHDKIAKERASAATEATRAFVSNNGRIPALHRERCS